MLDKDIRRQSLTDRELPEPIATMLAEHRTALDLIENLAAVTETPDVSKLAESMKGFIAFLDSHVQKEEALLFPPVRSLVSGDQALEAIESEHRLVAELKNQLAKLAADLGKNPTEAQVREASELTRRLADVLPAHIFKEDNILYPLVCRIVPQEKLAQMAARMGLESPSS